RHRGDMPDGAEEPWPDISSLFLPRRRRGEEARNTGREYTVVDESQRLEDSGGVFYPARTEESLLLSRQKRGARHKLNGC
ncbi:hypothetical protein K0M31_003902, partial [Melipona bicolor]